jgi:hypothetical protein
VPVKIPKSATTEKLAELLTESIAKMTPQEKAEIRREIYHHVQPKRPLMNWADFLETCTDLFWFDTEDRPKTVAAIQTLCQRVPSDVLQSLDILIFAPSQDLNGRVFSAKVGAETLVYLSPRIESLPQEEVDYVVAHEIAHAHLGHAHSLENANMEDEADALVVEWGFVVPDRRLKR